MSLTILGCTVNCRFRFADCPLIHCAIDLFIERIDKIRGKTCSTSLRRAACKLNTVERSDFSNYLHRLDYNSRIQILEVGCIRFAPSLRSMNHMTITSLMVSFALPLVPMVLPMVPLVEP